MKIYKRDIQREAWLRGLRQSIERAADRLLAEDGLLTELSDMERELFKSNVMNAKPGQTLAEFVGGVKRISSAVDLPKS